MSAGDYFSLCLDPDPCPTAVWRRGVDDHAWAVDEQPPMMSGPLVGSVNDRRLTLLDLLLMDVDYVLHRSNHTHGPVQSPSNHRQAALNLEL